MAGTATAANLLVDAVLTSVRRKLSHAGPDAFRTLASALQAADANCGGTLTRAQFGKALSRGRLFLPTHQVSQLARMFDVDECDRVQYSDFLCAVAQPLNARCRNVLRRAFRSLPCHRDNRRRSINSNNNATDSSSNADGTGTVHITDLIQHYARGCAQHPRVRPGLRQPAELAAEFARVFAGAGGGRRGYVTEDEFIAYYTHYRAQYLDQHEDLFVYTVECVFNVRESVDDTQRFVAPPDEGQSVRRILRTAAFQRSRAGQSPHQSMLQKFKHFDSSQSGTASLNEFRAVIECFGLTLAPALTEALFLSYPLTREVTTETAADGTVTETMGEPQLDYVAFVKDLLL